MEQTPFRLVKEQKACLKDLEGEIQEKRSELVQTQKVIKYLERRVEGTSSTAVARQKSGIQVLKRDISRIFLCGKLCSCVQSM